MTNGQCICSKPYKNLPINHRKNNWKNKAGVDRHFKVHKTVKTIRFAETDDEDDMLLANSNDYFL